MTKLSQAQEGKDADALPELCTPIPESLSYSSLGVLRADSALLNHLVKHLMPDMRVIYQMGTSEESVLLRDASNVLGSFSPNKQRSWD